MISRNGFTLVEALVSIIITGLIFYFGFLNFAGYFDLFVNEESKAIESQNVKLFFHKVKLELHESTQVNIADDGRSFSLVLSDAFMVDCESCIDKSVNVEYKFGDNLLTRNGQQVLAAIDAFQIRFADGSYTISFGMVSGSKYSYIISGSWRRKFENLRGILN